MILSWKERLYAYLLRKVVSPWLDDASLEKLHQSMEVSLSQGSFVLKNIGLDTDHLQSKLPPQFAYRITQATLERLDISLSLEEVHEEEHHDSTTAPTSSTTQQGSFTLAWRAMTQSSSTINPTTTTEADDSSPSTDSKTKIALVARVVVEGIVVHVEPMTNNNDGCYDSNNTPSASTTAFPTSTSSNLPTNSDNDDDTQQQIDATTSSSSAFSSYVSSYVEAAMASLRLSVQLQRLTLRFQPDDASPWIELSIQAASYQDGTKTDIKKQQTATTSALSSYHTIMHKAIDVTKLSVSVGGSLSSYDAYNDDDYDYSHQDVPGPTTIVLLDGTSRFHVRAVEYRISEMGSSTNPLQHDIELSLGQRLNLFVDTDALQRLDRLSKALQRLKQTRPLDKGEGPSIVSATNVTPSISKKDKQNALSASLSSSYRTTNTNDSYISSNMFESVNNSHFSANPSNNEEDYEALESIVTEQYQEARLHAERNEIRGGLLLPTAGEDGQVSFDAFFDANDQSFYRYSHMVLESSQTQNAACDNRGDASFVHTKIKLHLPSSRAKVMLTNDSYLLLTMTEVEASSSTAKHFTNHSCSISHVELEQAVVLAGTFTPKISTICAFTTINHSHQSADVDDSLLVQAPSLSLSVSLSKEKAGGGDGEDKEQTRIEVDLDLEPFVIFCPISLASDVSQFCKALPTTADKASVKVKNTEKDNVKEKSTVAIKLECPHFDICVPIEPQDTEEEQSPWANLFQRASIPASRYCLLNESAIGILLERLDVQCKDGSVETTFDRILFYGYLQSNTRGERRVMDLVSLCGETEPAMLRISNVNEIQDAETAKESSTSSNEPQLFSLLGQQKHNQNHPAAALFPTVPAISSFKAFQEDEDEDDSDHDVAGLSPARRELTGPDPQPEMLQSVSNATKIIELQIPSIHCDLSSDELVVFARVLLTLSPKKEPHHTSTEQDESNNQVLPPETISVSFSCEEMMFKIHAGTEGPELLHEHSFVMKLDQFRANLLRKEGCLRHIRVLSHDVSFFEAISVPGSAQETSELDSEGRTEALRHRIRLSPDDCTPLLHRSYLFRPISRQSPCILIDVMDLSENDGFVQKSIHFTLYDVTCRYDYDSKWIDRFKSLSQKLSSQLKGDSKYVKEGADTTPGSLTRLFLCLADCNVDYVTSLRWKTKARHILRLGELRVSSNLVQPSASLQAVKLALGDLSLCLCNSRFPYSFEDSRIFRQQNGATQKSDDALRKMNFRTVIMLDALDAILTIANDLRLHDSHPRLHLNLTIGEFSVFACKDSFSVFSGSIGELCAEACAMNEETFNRLKEASDAKAETFYDSIPHEENVPVESKETMPHIKLEDLKKKSALRPAVGTSNTDATFLLDGYDWTTIEQDESNSSRIPKDDEQVAKWYGSEPDEGKPTILRTGSQDETDSSNEVKSNPLKIISHHFPLQPTSDPLGDGDMGASKYSCTGYSPCVKTRLAISDASVKIRLFDGYDWPESLPEELRSVERKGKFVIDVDQESVVSLHEETRAESKNVSTDMDRKASLMADLLDSVPTTEESKTFHDLPLPQERGFRLKSQAEIRRLGRRSDKYFQFSASGIQIRNDSFVGSDEHRLASCLNVKLQDFFAAETISSNKPIKMVGEWFNDMDHPRDTSDGLLMMKMVTWNAKTRVSPEGDLANDEAEAVAKLLPLRCFLDQKAIRFMGAFFRSDATKNEEEEEIDKPLPFGLRAVPPPLFSKFIVKQMKLKVNYKPEKLDQKALRNGQIVELLNLSPLESLVITLKQEEVKNLVGFGSVISVLVPTWIQHVSSTQLIKFLNHAQPFNPITDIGGGMSDMVILPWEAIRKGGSFQRALMAGATSFGRAVAYETLSLTSSAAEAMASVGASSSTHSLPGAGHLLPSRPSEVPMGMSDTASHVVESLSRGFQAANARIVVIPYREYKRSGTTGLMTSVVRGIPVALTAPASGAAEAISYALLGMRNSVRPDIRREEEVAQRGLHFDA